MLTWKSYNLNRFANPTRCHPFNSFLQQPGVIICVVVILFATRGSIPLKNDHDEVFYWSCYVYCCERYDNQREESFKRWGKRRIHGFFCYRALSACSFLPGAVNLAKLSLVKYLFLPSAMSRKSHCSNDTCYVPIPPSRPSTRSLRGEEKSRESCREEREDKSEARARVRGRLARRQPLWLRWQVIPAHAPLRSLWLWNRPLKKGSGKGRVRERNIIYGSERGKKKIIIIIQGKTTRSSLTPQRLRERRGAGSGGCAKACDRSLSWHHSCAR